MPMETAVANVLSASVEQTESLILAALAERGSRMTRPRRQLASLLACQADAFSAEEVAAAVPEMGRATVYRTLRLLADAEVLCKARFPDRSRRYTLNRPSPLHQLTCVDCGRNDQLSDHEIERVVNAMDTHPGEVIGLRLYHRCGDAACRAATRRLPARRPLLRGRREPPG